ncbi:MAG: class I SAM-dependent methyltransferase, partial [Alphaproteobacteria bacterium]
MTAATDAERFQAEITRRYDAPMYRAMLEVYGDQIHPGFLEGPHDDLRTAALRATARLAELAGIAPGQSVLETACGVGGSARYLAAVRGARVVATNIARSQLAIALDWTRGKPEAARIRFDFADYHALPYPDGSFDAFWCQDSLLFSTDRPRALAEAARVVRPGGTVALSDLVVVGTPGAGAAALLAEISAPGLWSAEDYRKGLAAAGFAVTAVEDWGRHVLASFDRIADEIAAKRARLAAIASEADVAATLERYALWRTAARTGNLGWAALV